MIRRPPRSTLDRSAASDVYKRQTGFPIAKMAAKLAIGYTLDEIQNDITKTTPANFEPSIDYVVVKIPRWDFQKFKDVDDELGVQMKSVGEALAFGRTFKEALQKALRSMEQGRYGFGGDGKERYKIEEMSNEQILIASNDTINRLKKRTSETIFDIYDALKFNISIDEIALISGYDIWFLDQMLQIVEMENELKSFAHNLN